MTESQTISANELAATLRITERSVRRRAAAESWPYLNGDGKSRRYLIDKLPEGIKIEVKRLLERAVQDTPTATGVASLPAPVPVGSADLADWQNKVALARADLIRAYLDAKKAAKSKGQSVTAAADLFIKGYNTGQLLPAVYQTLGKVARQTVETWVRAFRAANHDYTALAPHHGNRRGKRKVTEDEFNTLLSFALHPNRLNIAECCRLTKLALKKRGVASPSSPATLRRALIDFKKAHFDRWVFCRKGEKALSDECLPYIERDASMLEVGELLVADGHPLNFTILHPFTGKPARMPIVIWYDWASRYPVGREILPTENVQSIAAALRHAILTLGRIPKVAYLDNGKAFKAKVFTDTSIDFEEAGFYGLFARLGIKTLFAWPYNAQSKPVERFFGTFSELEKLMPTYTGTSIATKPARLLRNEKLHTAAHQKASGGWVPTIAEALTIVDGWIAEYAKRPHRGLKGLTPAQVFASGKGPGVDEAMLRHLMMHMEIKTVGRNGVSLFGRRYYDEALYGLTKNRVTVRYDYDDLSRVFIYDVTGANLICEARPITPVHPAARILGTTEDLTAVKEAIKRKRRLKRQTEAAARAYVAGAPQLIPVPKAAPASETAPKRLKTCRLSRADAERIEAEAAKMKVLEFTPKAAQPLFTSEADRYEALLEAECTGKELPLDDMQFMRYFETTSIYRTLKERFDFLREFYIAGPEEKEAK